LCVLRLFAAVKIPLQSLCRYEQYICLRTLPATGHTTLRFA